MIFLIDPYHIPSIQKGLLSIFDEISQGFDQFAVDGRNGRDSVVTQMYSIGRHNHRCFFAIFRSIHRYTSGQLASGNKKSMVRMQVSNENTHRFVAQELFFTQI